MILNKQMVRLQSWGYLHLISQISSFGKILVAVQKLQISSSGYLRAPMYKSSLLKFS